MPRFVAAVAALAVSAVCFSAGSLERAGAVEASKASAKSTYQRQAFGATNAQRAAHDRAALARKKCVQRFAVKQAKAMAASQSMYHQDLGPIGENVAYGYSSGLSVVNDGWMHSEGHRANILNPDLTLMGIGARRGDNGYWYVAQVFGRKA